MSLRILISCGELSGDEHAARVVNELKKIKPDLNIRAMGGRSLRNAGVQTIVDSEHSASVMGFGELFGSLGRILRALARMKEEIKKWHPQLLILVDYPDFNLQLAKFASKHGCKVLYFISPQVWAWRQGRIGLFKKYVNYIAAILPFEEDFLKRHGYQNVSFVGHPFIDALKERTPVDKAELRRKLGLSEDPLLIVFPGSRKSEIKKHLAVVSEGLRKFKAAHPKVQVVINVAPSLSKEDLEPSLVSDFRVLKHDPIELMEIADGALLKSGTSNLQAAALGLPFTMFYIANKSSAWIVRRFVKIKEYSIVNILRPNTVREILQEEATPEIISAELSRLIHDVKYREDMLAAFHEICLLFNRPKEGQSGYQGTGQNVARLALQLAEAAKIE